jgi:hypothetical protein
MRWYNFGSIGDYRRKTNSVRFIFVDRDGCKYDGMDALNAMQHRFKTDFGSDGMEPGSSPRQGSLTAFGARYRFIGRTWGLVVWARDWDDANEYARRHGLEIDGKIEATFEA